MDTKHKKLQGVTLIELTIVILVLLTLLGILFFSAQAWKRGVERSTCIINLRQVQMAVRSYQNLNERNIGSSLPLTDIIGPDGVLIDQPRCPNSVNASTANSGYSYSAFEVPNLGTLYMECNLRPEGHHPSNTTGW